MKQTSKEIELNHSALDLYKRDMGIAKTARKPKTQKSNKSAADMVSTKTTAVEPTSQEKIWTEQEIARMSIAEFDKYEEEIGRAIHEGRIVKQ